MRYREVGPLRRLVRRAAGTRAMSRVYAPTLHRLDRLVYRATGGRVLPTSVLTGLPIVLLTTTGARSGHTSTVPLIGLPDGDDTVVIASNWGSERNPGWYHNLRATPDATITIDGSQRRVRAREATGDERARLWRQGLEFYPGWTAYEARAGDRQIPVMVLEPVPDGDVVAG
jgi:deazaflavin-dependent oxidoreductase (nitroreductase family)